MSGVRDGHRNRKSQKSLRFRCAKPDTLAFLARTPTRKRLPHSTVHECLKAFFRHARFKMHRHAVYHCFKKPPTLFRHASVFKTRGLTRACPFLKRTFSPISGPKNEHKHFHKVFEHSQGLGHLLLKAKEDKLSR